MSDQPTTPEPNGPDTPSRCGGRRPSSCYAAEMTDSEGWLVLSMGVGTITFLALYDWRLGVAYFLHFVGKSIANPPAWRPHNDQRQATASTKL
jgi:hypothetical protein